MSLVALVTDWSRGSGTTQASILLQASIVLLSEFIHCSVSLTTYPFKARHAFSSSAHQASVSFEWSDCWQQIHKGHEHLLSSRAAVSNSDRLRYKVGQAK